MLPETIQHIISQARAKKQKLIFVTGVFDVLHIKHADFLKDAKALDGVLIVGLESDTRVREMKGAERPINTQASRVRQLEELNIADAVFVLPDDFGKPEVREELIDQMRPDFLAVSSHSLHQEKKQQLMEKYGGRLVVVTQYDPRFSSTQAIAESKK
jgi:rfaE bifunctional protein nucleotidyltransferase chain/domain